jgi:hypothetical protein
MGLLLLVNHPINPIRDPMISCTLIIISLISVLVAGLLVRCGDNGLIMA